MNAPFSPTLPAEAPTARGLARPDPLCGEILPADLPRALDLCPRARVLSLDCFDTLLWRDTHAPADIFASLPGTSPLQRRSAETLARRIARHGARREEVTIAEIYASLFPAGGSGTTEAAKRAIAAELAAEARHCFAFAPTVALMRAARAKGLQVVIVSDTYLDATQLRALIAAAAGADIAGLIDRVFCSSAHGKPKAGGLYGDVLRKLPFAPHEILHIGDNHGADVDGIKPFGVNTLHLKQFAAPIERQLRLEAAMDAMIHPRDASLSPSPLGMPSALQPHRATLALVSPATPDPAEAFGLAALGPVFAGFERWLSAEAAALRERHGGRVHWLFLMRDGYLPMAVHQATTSGEADNVAAPGTDPCHAVEISRFTATAAALARDGEALAHVLREMGTMPGPLAKQLLFTEAEIARLITGRTPEQAAFALLAEVRRGDRRRAIQRAARGMAQRLVAHVRRIVDPAPGDTLMLIDLGYNGTVQNRIDALLSAELGVHVAGRYLLLREIDRPGLDKAGFIDARHYDPPTLEAMCANVSVIEQMATTSMGSVTGYADDGEALRRENVIGETQRAIRARVQAGVLRFVAADKSAVQRGDALLPEAQIDLWRHGAAASLMRLMFLPSPEELALFAGFEHDVNLGTERKVALFDSELAARGLRQRGLFHLHGSERMYLPAELADAGLPTRLTLLAAKRFALPLAFTDFAGSVIELPVIFANSVTGEAIQSSVTATATHEGYYLAALPVGDGQYGVAAVLGAVAEWCEVDSVSLWPIDDFLTEGSDGAQSQQPLVPQGDGMTELAPRLWHASHAGGFLFIQPPDRRPGAALMVAVVFRPIVRRPGPSTATATRPTRANASPPGIQTRDNQP